MEIKVMEHFKFLGFRAKDVIAGAEGVITSIAFDISGCVQGFLSRGFDKEGKRLEGYWIDTKQILIMSKSAVMPAPAFLSVTATAGAQSKTSPDLVRR